MISVALQKMHAASQPAWRRWDGVAREVYQPCCLVTPPPSIPLRHFSGVTGGPATMVDELGDSGGGEKRRNGLALPARRGDGGEEAVPPGTISILLVYHHTTRHDVESGFVIIALRRARRRVHSKSMRQPARMCSAFFLCACARRYDMMCIHSMLCICIIWGLLVPCLTLLVAKIEVERKTADGGLASSEPGT